MRKLFLLLLVTIHPLLFAAGPIAHAFFTEMFFEKFPGYSEEDRFFFRRGTLFPDIRYLGEIDRQDTHFGNISLEDILKETSPFYAGLKFHSFVDQVREDFVIQQNMYEKIPETIHKTTFLKLLEDEILFYRFDREIWSRSLDYFNAEEFEWQISERNISKWHFLLQICFTNPPSELIVFLMQQKRSFFNIPLEELQSWNEKFETFCQSSLMQDFVQKMINHFESILN